ncbi:hypothetical protein ATANTOWER_001818 [Ataeniobius toweri]|uniref:Serine aminopeptidase S33 domain-containing protein n=1 Tax=Ataeniobius toweri TaxID=208326 RepID=A0ABU7ACV7_9TELE|nr:hypothetical protein [Ataeniobius toweri]
MVLIAPMVQMNPESATPFKIFMAKLLNHMLPSLTLGSIESKWVSRDKKQDEDHTCLATMNKVNVHCLTFK